MRTSIGTAVTTLMMASLVACATAQSSADPTPELSAPREHAFVAPPPATEHHTVEPVPVAVGVDDPVTRGELPWWHAMKDGIYRMQDEVVVLAVGESSDYHHVLEGFLHSKVAARIGVRRAAERIRFKGAIPEPVLLDLFVTRERSFLALYMIRVPKDADAPASLPSISPPGLLKMEGRRHVGRHIFEGDRHLFLECDVEGPIANPDWGRMRASARG